MSAESPRPRPSAGMVNAAAALLILLVVVPLALRASQTAPPAVAEFAPRVPQPIKQAPAEQTSVAGNGTGGSGSGAAPAPSPAPSPSPLPGGVVFRQCVGDPP